MSSAGRDTEPTSSAASLVCIVNGNASGSGPPDETARSVVAALTAEGASAQAVVTRSEQELYTALRAAGGGRAVLVGGDGSLHAAVNAPVDLPELALVATGRANNVARQLGIPRDLAAAARVAARSPARALDVLRVQTPTGCRRCVEGLSGGLQARARDDYDAENSGNTLAGIRAMLGALARYRPYEVELELDGRPAYRGLAGQVFVSNLALFGFGFEVNPAAQPADGRLEAVVMRTPTRRAALLMLARAYRGRHLASPDADWRRARRAVLSRPLPLACDGVPIGTSPATVTVEPGRLRLAAPPPR